MLKLKRLKLYRQTRSGNQVGMSPKAKALYDRNIRTLEKLNKEIEANKLIQNKGEYNLLIADEAHHLKGSSSFMHAATLHFIGDLDTSDSKKKKGSGLVLMTGTPIHNTLLDAYAMIKLLTPGVYISLKAFERIHSVYVFDPENNRKTLVGFKHKETITQNLYLQARRVTKDQVFTMQEPRIIEVPVKLSKEHAHLYQELVTKRVLDLGDTLIDARTAQSLRMKCLQIVTTPLHFTQKPILDNQIKETLLELVDSLGVVPGTNTPGIEGIEKVVIFANFRRSVEEIAEWFKEYNPAVLYGDTHDQDKERNKFLKDKTCKILVSNPKSGGVGLNLQSVCRYVIFAEPVSVPGEFKQASERVYRIGQKRVVSVYIMKAMGTIAPTLTRKMLGKEVDTLQVTQDKRSLMQELLGQVA
jgi:SNF2 family DNA or RNA helicase